jgi:cell division protein FtsB
MVVAIQQVVVQQQQMQLQQNEMDKLRSDNVKLYEKIKFLQSYSGKVMKSNSLVRRKNGMNAFD